MNRLKNSDVIAYAERAAKILGLELPARERVLRNLEAKITVQVCTETMQLWIDPYYIAYSRRGKNEKIHYVYLTEYHIAEEYESYARARRSQKNDEKLPAEIEQDFEAARKAMRRTGRQYIVDRDFFLRAP